MYVSNAAWKRNSLKDMKNAQQSYLQTETFDSSGTVHLFAQNEFNFIPLSLSACFRRHPCSATESEMKK